MGFSGLSFSTKSNTLLLVNCMSSWQLWGRPLKSLWERSNLEALPSWPKRVVFAFGEFSGECSVSLVTFFSASFFFVLLSSRPHLLLISSFFITYPFCHNCKWVYTLQKLLFFLGEFKFEDWHLSCRVYFLASRWWMIYMLKVKGVVLLVFLNWSWGFSMGVNVE